MATLKTSTESFRLSPQQRHLCALQQRDEIFPYRAQYVVRLEGPLDICRLSDALEQLVKRHEILRTSFPCPPGLTLPMQVIDKAIPLPLVLHDYSAFSPQEQQDLLLGLQASGHPPLLKERSEWQVTLVIGDEKRHWLLWDLSALNADARSCQRLVQELSQFYMNGAVEND